MGFALFNPDGTLKSSSNNLQRVNFPNLLTSPQTQRWFKQALNSEGMVIGKPYQLNPLDRWVIPIRKRIIDDQGKVIGLIASELDLEKFQNNGMIIIIFPVC